MLDTPQKYNFSGHDNVEAVAVDKQDNVIVVGNSDTGTFPNAGVAIVKYNPQGNLIQKTHYAFKSTDGEIRDAIVNADGEIYLTGFHSPEATSRLAFLTLKYTPDLTLLWEQAYYWSEQTSRADAMALDSQGNVLVTGYAHAVGGSAGDNDIITIKYAPTGNLLAERGYDSGKKRDDRPSSLAVGVKDDIVIVGTSNLSGSSQTGNLDDIRVLHFALTPPATVLFANPEVQSDASLKLPVYLNGVANSNVTMLLIVDGQDDPNTLVTRDFDASATGWQPVGTFSLPKAQAIGSHTFQVRANIQEKGEMSFRKALSDVMQSTVLDFVAKRESGQKWTGDGWAFTNAFPNYPLGGEPFNGLCFGMSKQVSDAFNRAQPLPLHSDKGPTLRMYGRIASDHAYAAVVFYTVEVARIYASSVYLGSNEAVMKADMGNIFYKMRNKAQTSVMVLYSWGDVEHAVVPHAGFLCADFYDANDKTAKKNLLQLTFYDPDFPGDRLAQGDPAPRPLYAYLFDMGLGADSVPNLKFDRNVWNYPFAYQYTGSLTGEQQ